MRKSSGFTLIELLVVIAVIALLLSILMPALSKAKDLAMGAACKGNLKNYTFAIAMYCDDYDGKFPQAERCYFSQLNAYPVESSVSDPLHLRWCNGDVDLKSHPEYGGQLFSYLMDAKSFICPAFKRLAVRNSDDQFFQAYGSSIRNYEPWYNYTMNAYVGSDNSGIRETRVLNISEVRKPATTFSFTEESSYVDTEYNASGLNDTFMIPGDDTMVQGWLSQVGGNPMLVEPGPDSVGQFYDVIAGFHHAPTGNKLGGRGNCAFIDGHVDSHYRRETFYLAWPK
ncbi:MAG: type II secretion system protein [Sedimentisphaerales bacterium]|nr:type II secretion system protein [Sedimentisphaerales bacterium]